MDLSDENPEIVARLILYMYFSRMGFATPGGNVWTTSLAKLLNRSVAMKFDKISSLPTFVSAADKYQMPEDLAHSCQEAYEDMLEDAWYEEDTFLEFIASIKVIYQTAPRAGLRGRAITRAQIYMVELQHREDFRKLMLSTPEFAVDVATKGLRQSLWCNECRDYVDITPYKPLVVKLWGWIDQGKPQDWTQFKCPKCEGIGTVVEEVPE